MFFDMLLETAIFVKRSANLGLKLAILTEVTILKRARVFIISDESSRKRVHEGAYGRSLSFLPSIDRSSIAGMKRVENNSRPASVPSKTSYLLYSINMPTR